jgi:hypothetical protein
MAKKSKEVVIERGGTLSIWNEPEGLLSPSCFWLKPDLATNLASTSYDMDIARAAVELGYKAGDKVKYRIVIEPKR